MPIKKKSYINISFLLLAEDDENHIHMDKQPKISVLALALAFIRQAWPCLPTHDLQFPWLIHCGSIWYLLNAIPACQW